MIESALVRHLVDGGGVGAARCLALLVDGDTGTPGWGVDWAWPVASTPLG